MVDLKVAVAVRSHGKSGCYVSLNFRVTGKLAAMFHSTSVGETKMLTKQRLTFSQRLLVL